MCIYIYIYAYIHIIACVQPSAATHPTETITGCLFKVKSSTGPMITFHTSTYCFSRLQGDHSVFCCLNITAGFINGIPPNCQTNMTQPTEVELRRHPGQHPRRGHALPHTKRPPNSISSIRMMI